MGNVNTITSVSFPSGTIVAILRTQASHCPQRRVYTFLGDEEGSVAHCTYAELDARARAIAACLQAEYTPGERALLLYPPGLDYIAGFLGCLYAGVVAVPAYPPDPFRLARTLPRLQSIVADAQATVALTTTPILDLAAMVFQMAPDLAALRWIATDAISADAQQSWHEPDLTLDSLAFLQYTSGSTGTPRGVMLSHRNLLHNSQMIIRALDLTPDSVAVLWLPPYHDMGLIGGILQPLLVGLHVVLMSPMSFLQQPYRWLKAISDYKATIAGGPNFAYDLCARKITSDERATLDLSSWKVAFNGAEPVRHETLDRFASIFAPCGFRREAFQPCYGLAEATLFVSGGEQDGGPRYLPVSKAALAHNRVEITTANDENSQILVSCGSIQPGESIAIVNPESRARVPPDGVGEIWISGPSIAQGYWQRPGETEETFRAYLADGEGPFLRTGDMGFIHEQQLYITGRIKDLIIIRGRNHYPQDIELTVERSHPALRPGCCAAFPVDVSGEERLVVVQEVDTRKNPDPAEIVQRIRQAVSEEHDLQVYAVVLIKPHTIAKTSSGKIQRRACRDEYLQGKLDVIMVNTLATTEPTPVDQRQPQQTLLHKALLALPPAERQQVIESHLRDKVARLLHVNSAQIDTNRSVTALGIDSVVAVDLVSEIEDDLAIAIPMSMLMQGPSIRQLAEHIAAGLGPSPQAMEAEPAPLAVQEYPLSRGQRALWFLHQLAPHDPTYIIARAVRIPGEINMTALRRAFQDLVDRQPSLRTSFAARDGEPVQLIHDHVEVNFEEVDAQSWSDAELEDRLVETAYRPFDLSQNSLLRVTVFTRSPLDHILLVAVHHIVADLWSLAVFISELGAFITAESNGVPADLPPLKSQYIDHVRAEAEMLAGPEGERLWAYWRKQLGGELPVLNLMTDKPRPPIPNGMGSAESLVLGPELTQKLKALAQAHDATPFMTLLAAFQVLLHRYTGQDDILVGTPKAGRNHKMARVVGFFVNSVVMRANLAGDPTFAAFLERTRDTVRAGLDHGDFPFALLVEKLQPERDLSRSPVFQAMFAWQKTTRLVDNKGLSAFSLNEAGGRMPLGPLTMESLPLKVQVSPFDLTLLMTEADGDMAASLEYRCDLFEKGTIRRMLDHFKVLLEGVVADPLQRISRLPLLTDAERRQLIEWNMTRVGKEEEHCVHELVAQQAARTPEATAVIADEGQLSYRELNERANRLAHYLCASGLKPGDVVGLYARRGLDAIVGILGLLKAGGTYLPLDPTFPAERVSFMLEDARARFVLTHKQLRDGLSHTASQLAVICLDDTTWSGQHNASEPAVVVGGHDISYIIYTSGSTGRPKGVMISHRVFANHCRDVQHYYGLQPSDRVLQFTALIFDPSLEQIFPTLMTGATLVLRGDEMWTAADFRRRVADYAVTVANIPPAFWQQVVEEWPREGQPPTTSLRLLIIGGDVVPPETIRLWQQTPLRTARLLNAYGPTEAVITATAYDVPPALAEAQDLTRLPIGRPLPNRTTHILDKYGNPMPIGVPGELCLGGRLAEGYLNQPDLTAEKFVRIQGIGDGTQSSVLYKTGDLARYLPDGNIDFLGRIDQQVKVRGFRIELGEIEAVLGRCPGVREAIVVAHDNREHPGDKTLVAYVVPTDVTRPPAADELRHFLRSSLPDYMVPAAYVTLDAFPLTPSGKVDRRALPAPESGQLTRAYVAPRNPVEEQIASICAQLLRVEHIGINDNFFEMGGHSLLATQLVSRLRAIYNVDIPLRSLFENPTVAGLALVIAQAQAEQADRAEVERILAELEQLSESDVQILLDES